MANSRRGNKRASFPWLSRALKHYSPGTQFFPQRKPQSGFPCPPTSIYSAWTELQAEKWSAWEHTAHGQPIWGGRKHPCCIRTMPLTQRQDLWLHVRPGAWDPCTDANSGYQCFSDLCEMQQKKQAGLPDHCTELLTAALYGLFTSARVTPYISISAHPHVTPLILPWRRAFQIGVIQICLTQTLKSFSNCNFVEANCLPAPLS